MAEITEGLCRRWHWWGVETGPVSVEKRMSMSKGIRVAGEDGENGATPERRIFGL